MKFIKQLLGGGWAELATIAAPPRKPATRPTRANIQYLRT